MAVDLDCWLKPTPKGKPTNSTLPEHLLAKLTRRVPETQPDLPVMCSPEVLAVGDGVASGKHLPPEKEPSRFVRYTRAIIGGAFLSATGWAMCQPASLHRLWEHLGEHMLAGLLYAAYALWRRTGKHTPTVGNVERELRHDLKHALTEGLLFGAATSLFDCFIR